MYQDWSARNGGSFALNYLRLMCPKCVGSLMRVCLGSDVSFEGRILQAISHSHVSMN